MPTLKSQMNYDPFKTDQWVLENNPRSGVPNLNQIGVLYDALLTDCYCSIDDYSFSDYTKDKQTMYKRLNVEGIGFATKTLPNLAKGLFDYLQFGHGVYHGFHCRGGYPVFLRGLFHIVYLRDQRLEVVANAIKCIYQISVYTKKVSGDFKVEQLRKQFDSFVAVDKGLEDIFENLDNDGFQILQLARHLFADFSKDIEPDNGDFIPRPGPGATNTKCPLSLRYMPLRFYQQHQGVFPYEEWFYSHPWDIVTEACAAPTSFKKIKEVAPPILTARFMYVPKIYGTARGICIEENESQWLQQAVANALRTSCEEKLQGQINFVDQTVNQQLALDSSATEEHCTIDGSEASDRVPRDIVSWISQDNVWLHNALMALSTRFLKTPVYDGKHLHKDRLIHLNKYAAMGSGLCFPVMSLVHYTLVKAIIMRAYRTDETVKVYVYGDDIIFPTKYADAVYRDLPKFGMKLNRTKSFSSGLFRESCGIHAFNGHVITPTFLRKTIIPGNAETFVSALSTEELLEKSGFRHTASALRTICNRYEKIDIPFVTTGSALYGWKRPWSFFEDFDPIKLGIASKWRIGRDKGCKRDVVIRPSVDGVRWISTQLTCKPYYDDFQFRVRVIQTGRVEDTVTKEHHHGYLRYLVQETRKSLHFQDTVKQPEVVWQWVTESGLTGHN